MSSATHTALFPKHRQPFSVSLKAAALLFCAGLVLSACTSMPPSSSPEVRNERGIELPDESLLDSLLRDAEALQGAEAAGLYLEAAQLLHGMDDNEQAASILAALNTDDLPLALSAEIIATQAEILIAQDEAAQALQLLTSERLIALPQLPAQLQVRIRQLRAQSYHDTGQFLLSAQERIYLDNQLSTEQKADNHGALWRSLQQLPVAQLTELAEESISYEFQGWYELAIIGLRYQFNLDLQQVELERWRDHWVRHPAAAQLPAQLQLIANLSERRPTRIALLLPLQSSAGKIVRDGFMSAYFNARDIGISVPEVRFYDTSRDSDILALHQQARDEGAELIVGPLLKQHVTTLASVRTLGVPTLALNTADNSRPRSSQLYQFALAPESEGRQIAQRAWQDGHRRVAILSPVDEISDDFYKRKRDSFIAEWQALGGEIAVSEQFASDYTQAIAAMLGINASEYRREELADLLNTQLEFTPRRRQDIDFIFLVAQPGPARQIKPSLGYLYAGELPVYATQDIYSGTQQPQINTDLNGILFSDAPWLLAQYDDLKEEAQSLFPQSSAQLLRLQGFGVDAFRLYPRLEQLEEMDDGRIYGATGQLYMSEDRHIEQLYSWAQIRSGLATLLEAGVPGP